MFIDAFLETTCVWNFIMLDLFYINGGDPRLRDTLPPIVFISLEEKRKPCKIWGKKGGH